MSRGGWWVLAVLLLPTAAAGATLQVESAKPVALAGAMEVAMPGASLHFLDATATGPREIAGVNGTVSIWTWRVVHEEAAPAGLVEYDSARRVGDATAETFQVRNATLRFVPSGVFELTVRAGENGTVGVSGPVEGSGFPTRLPPRVAETALTPDLTPGRAPEDVAWRYEPGWAYVGDELRLPQDAFPALPEARVRFEGPLDIKAGQGRVEFVDATGAGVARDLGAFPERSLAMGNVTLVRRLVLHGEAHAADLPAGASWSLAGPRASWTLQGDATWRDASGEVGAGAQRHAFTHADLAVKGALTILPDPGAADPPVAAARYHGSGDFEATVAGEALASPPAGAWPALVPTVSWTAAILGVALLAWRLLAALYTRIAPQDALAHPRRRAIYDAVQARPGERLRDLQRALGMAWGAFSFHLQVLVAQGYVRLRREGAYRLVLPMTTGAGAGPLIPHPAARAVYDALPADGSPIACGELGARLGFSRQRLDHHLVALRSRGLVEVRQGPGRERQAARKLAHQ